MAESAACAVAVAAARDRENRNRGAFPQENHSQGAFPQENNDRGTFPQAQRNHQKRDLSRLRGTTEVFVDKVDTPLRRLAYKIAFSKALGLLVMAGILVTFMILVARGQGYTGYKNITDRVEIGNTIVFVTEIALKLYAVRCDFFRDGWNLCDLAILIADVFTEAVDLGGIKISVFRCIRVLRLTKVLQGKAVFRELYLMLTGMISMWKALVWSCVVTFFILTLISLFAVEVIHPLNLRLADEGLYEGCERCSRAYESVMASNLTFFQVLLAGDSWGAVTIPIIERWPWSMAFFGASLVIVEVGLLNLVVTVILDASASARDEDEELKASQKRQAYSDLRRHIKEVCQDLDTDGDSQISRQEIYAGYSNSKEFRDILNTLDMQWGEMAELFSLLDNDKSGKVTETEFFDGLFRLRFQEPQNTLFKISMGLKQVESRMDQIEASGKRREEMLEKLLMRGFPTQASNPDATTAMAAPITLERAEPCPETCHSMSLKRHAEEDSTSIEDPLYAVTTNLRALQQDILLKIDQQTEILTDLLATNDIPQPFPCAEAPLPHVKRVSQREVRASRPGRATFPPAPRSEPDPGPRCHSPPSAGAPTDDAAVEGARSVKPDGCTKEGGQSGVLAQL